MLDVGDTYPITVNVRDSTGTLIAAGSVVITVTLPDGTTSTPSVLNPSTGVYVSYFAVTLAGLHSWRAVAMGGSLAYAQSTTDSFYVQKQTAVPMISLAEAKDHLKVTTTASDEKLRNFLNTASALVEGYARRVWTRRTVVDSFDQSTGALRLRTYPIISITSITDAGQAITTGYTLTSKGILWVGLTDGFYRWIGPTVVTYVAGAADGIIPETIRMAVKEQIRHMWETQTGGKGSNSQGDLDAATEQQFAIPWRVKGLIESTPDLGIGI